MADAEAPIACNLGALSKAERARRAILAREIQRSARRVSELPEGFELALRSPPATAQQVVEWFLLERRCCPFLRFSLELEPGSEDLRIRLSGRAGVKAFLVSAGLGAAAPSPAAPPSR